MKKIMVYTLSCMFAYRIQISRAYYNASNIYIHNCMYMYVYIYNSIDIYADGLYTRYTQKIGSHNNNNNYSIIKTTLMN